MQPLGMYIASNSPLPALIASHSLLQAGCSKVFITSRKSQACTEACEALNSLGCSGRAIPIPADLAKTSEIERLVSEVSKHTDKIDFLLANAGATWGAPFDEHPESAFAKVMDLNVKSVFVCCQKFAPMLRKAGTKEDPSRIIITASVVGLGIGTLGEHGTYGYSASKAAALSLTKNLAVELGPQNILTTAICPGFFPTKMASGLMEMTGGTKQLAAETPNQRLGVPEDIAGTIVYLCSRAGSHVNGGHVVLDGGALIGKSRL